MLSSTYILRFIEKKLGYKFNELEMDPDEIIDNIKEETLVTFSNFFPYQIEAIISNEDKVEGTGNQYYINTDYNILNVARMYDNTTRYFGAELVPYSNNMIDPVSRQIQADLSSMNRNPMTYQFTYPNIITITPALYTIRKTKLLLNVVHPDHFGTIPTNLQTEFLKLALYDTKEVLYQIRKRFANLQTAFGNIELFVDELQEATDRKQELLDKWRQNVAKQANRKKLYIY
ncbi:hypothetical protein Goe21_01280 [Bacillus phage vB_BsuM-Goe21]|nr:hypothetical protein Goe21_01280 [Bacillus phage vB_BsuM-Goe21]